MMSPARNQPCPCGSGKKYKKCCLDSANVSNNAQVFPLGDRPKVVVFSGPMLMNRAEREANVIAKSFDAICREAVSHLEEMYSDICALLYVSLDNAKASGDELRYTSAVVLTNALKSVTAAFSLLRTGWRLQPYLCLRNGMEAVSTVLHVFHNPDDLQRFKTGRLHSSRTLASAKAAIPPIGKLYGILSEEFVHVGKPFIHIQKATVYTESEWEMWQCLASISGYAQMVYMVAELLFYDWASERNCWIRVNQVAYALHWSDEMKRWRSEYVRIYQPHYHGQLIKQ